jgi:hypothetical protein
MVNPAAETGAVSRGPRPATVVVAGVLQIVAVVFLLGLVAIAWFARAQHDGWAAEAARLATPGPGELEAEYAGNLVMAIAVSVVAGGAALWLGATVWPLLRGSNVARILAAVAAFGIAGLSVLAAVGSFLLGFLFIAMFAAIPFEDPGFSDVPPDSGDFSSGSAFQDTLWEMQGGPAVADVMPLLVFASTALLAAVAILLVIGPTNRWYAPERAVRARAYPVYYYPVYVPVPYAAWQPPAPAPPPSPDA